MSEIQVGKLFTKQFLTEQEDVLRDRERQFPDATGSEFEAGLDGSADGSEFETDGLGFDPDEVAQDNFAEVYSKVDRIEDMIEDLLDPNNPKNLTRLLATYDRKDSVGNGLLQKLQKPIGKAADELSSVKNALNQIASAEPSIQRKIKALQSNA